MRKVAVIAISMLLFLQFSCFSDGLAGIPDFIHSPKDVVAWFNSDFNYLLTIPDEPQSPEETLRLRTGDCDDFAALAYVVLESIGVRSHILIIKYRGLKIRHAICMWQNDDGTYSFISNKELWHTRERSVEAAVCKIYPDSEKITFTDVKRDCLRTISLR